MATGESSWVLPSSESAVVWDPCLAEDGLTWFYVPRAGNGWAFNFSEGYADWTSVSSTSASVSTDQLGGARGAKLLQDASVTHRLRDDGDGNLWLQSAYTVIRKSSSVQNKTSAGGGAAALKSRKRLTDQARNSAHSNEHVNTSSFQVVAYDARVRAGKAASYAGSNTVEVGHTQWEFPNTGWMLTQETTEQSAHYTHVESGVRTVACSAPNPVKRDRHCVPASCCCRLLVPVPLIAVLLVRRKRNGSSIKTMLRGSTALTRTARRTIFCAFSKVTEVATCQPIACPVESLQRKPSADRDKKKTAKGEPTLEVLRYWPFEPPMAYIPSVCAKVVQFGGDQICLEPTAFGPVHPNPNPDSCPPCLH